MKKSIFLFLSLLPLLAAAQKSYTISGKLPAVKGQAKAYLVTLQGDQFKETDSVVIKNGQFQFTGKVDQPQSAIIAVKRSPESGKQTDNLSFYLENSKITLTGKDSIKTATVAGSVSDREDRELSALITPFTKRIMKIQREFTKDHGVVEGKTLEQRKEAQDSINSYVKQIKNIQLKFVESHPNSFMGLYTFNTSILGSHFDSAEVKPLFYKFSPQLQSSSLGKLAIDRILANEKRAVGVKIIDFSQTDINGKPFHIRSLRGKYVFLDFWASWCYWCRAENPNVLKAYEQLKDRNLEIVSVSFDESKAAWENAIKQDKLPWLQVSDLKGMKVRDGLAAMLDIKAIPQNLLISPEGVIIATNLRGEDLPAKLSKLIK
ncbi:thioredoxin [Pedobacter sp. HMWF019]|uniref:TlpA disulfide reductase family protein n=1 Tax=Pedobacter sp. HMWF019 TaxID=2056856 RepID=UPI000D3A1C11|nr:TlpA disulfide reductase family protein [Pedobacter sp. HMWF019]PTS92373.1 thioredoxin [Pedobacter sp. HMWF019]